MQKQDKINLFFYSSKDEVEKGFERNSMRRNFKAALELSNVNYSIKESDDFDAVFFTSIYSENKLRESTTKEYKKIVCAFFNEEENKQNLYNFKDGKNPNISKLRDTCVKKLNEYDVVLVPSLEAEVVLRENGVTSKIEKINPPVRSKKFDLALKSRKNISKIYFKFSGEQKYVHLIINRSDVVAEKRILDIARTFPKYKFIVIIPDMKRNSFVKNFIFRKYPSNMIIRDVLEEDVYISMVYNSLGLVMVNSCPGNVIESFECMTIKKPILSLKESTYSDVLIDKKNAHIYNNLEALKEGVKDLFEGKLEPLNKEGYLDDRDNITNTAKKVVEIYKELKEN